MKFLPSGLRHAPLRGTATIMPQMRETCIKEAEKTKTVKKVQFLSPVNVALEDIYLWTIRAYSGSVPWTRYTFCSMYSAMPLSGHLYQQRICMRPVFNTLRISICAGSCTLDAFSVLPSATLHNMLRNVHFPKVLASAVLMPPSGFAGFGWRVCAYSIQRCRHWPSRIISLEANTTLFSERLVWQREC